jgi:hypothetical protein
MQYQFFALTIVVGLLLPYRVMAGAIDVFVGYADNVRPNSFSFPTPWLGDPGILDVGHAAGQVFDAGAIRIDNNTGAPLTVDNVTVDGFGTGRRFSLWGSFTIPNGMKAILTQTNSADGAFDTSDESLGACCTPLGDGVEPFPKVHLRIHGKTVTFGDLTHVLDTKGFDILHVPPGNTNESHQWSLTTPLSELTANDIDGDGRADLVWRHSTTGAVLVWLLDGAAPPFAMTIDTLSDLDWQVVGVGDVNGDGRADLVWRQTLTGQVAVWFFNGTTLSGGAPVGAPLSLDWQLVGIGDVNGDGRADLVWRHTRTGDVAVWLLNGSTLLSGAVVASGVPLAWDIQ